MYNVCATNNTDLFSTFSMFRLRNIKRNQRIDKSIKMSAPRKNNSMSFREKKKLSLNV